MKNIKNKEWVDFNMEAFEEIFPELTLTGSRVFSDKKKDGDYDYFGLWYKYVENKLIDRGFTLEDRSYFLGSKRYCFKNFDVFLFIEEDFYDNYEKAHWLAESLKLRDLFKNKKDFLDVFIMMRGRYNKRNNLEDNK